MKATNTAVVTKPGVDEVCSVLSECDQCGRRAPQFQSVYAQELSRAGLPEIRTRLGTPKILR
jgi:hypothetical protein